MFSLSCPCIVLQTQFQSTCVAGRRKNTNPLFNMASHPAADLHRNQRGVHRSDLPRTMKVQKASNFAKEPDEAAWCGCLAIFLQAARLLPNVTTWRER
jgi:hypothetical protein